MFAPGYYKAFRCIADRCRHSCCVGWEIDIDVNTEEKYSLLTEGYGAEIIKSIDFEDTPHFRLGENERCPHLDERGLCRIICELGEDYLCDICREHPRFYNYTARGVEVGIGMACEEACRLILGSDNYEVVEVDEGEKFLSDGFDAVALRDDIYAILGEDLPYRERLKKIYGSYSVSPSEISDGEWRELIDSLEYLYPSHKELFSVYSSALEASSDWERQLERALAYFVFRHCGSALDYGEFKSSLGFCLFCERLLASLSQGDGDIFELARIISEELEYSEDNTETIKEIFG